MLILASLLGVAFWVWVIDGIVNDDDDSASESDDVVEDVAINQGDNDLLEGLEGDDNLFGGVGEDILVGDEGDDRLFGGDDDDILLGGDDDDLVRGGDDDDTIVGGSGADTLNGDSGDDLIIGSSGFDESAFLTSLEDAETTADLTIQFNDEADTDTGDVIDGGNGEDTIVMGSEDSVTGGADADLFAGGWWIRPGEPAIIEDYDEAEDILTYTYEEGTTEPVITTSIDAATGDATVYADGDEVIIIIDAGAGFNANNVMLLQAA